MRKSYNILINTDFNWHGRKASILFGKIDKEDVLMTINYDVNYPKLLVALGLASSRKEVRNNGYKLITEGFTDFYYGKKKTRLTIFKGRF